MKPITAFTITQNKKEVNAEMNNTRTMIISAIFLVVIFTGVLLVIVINFIESQDGIFGIFTYDSKQRIECSNDCSKLGLNYFKWVEGGFGKESCVCFDSNKNVKQIW